MVRSYKSVANLYFWADLFTLFFTFCIAIFYFQKSDFRNMEWVFLINIVMLWTVIGYSRRLYISNWRRGFFSKFLSFTKSYLILLMFVTFIFLLFNFPMEFRTIIFAFFFIFLIMGLTTNFFLGIVINTVNKKKNNKIYTLVAGKGSLTGHIENHIIANDRRHKIRGFVKAKKETALVREDKVSGELKDMNQYLLENPVDEIILALPLKASKKARKILEIADHHGIRVKYVFDYKDTFGRNSRMTKYGQFEAVNVRQLPLDGKVASTTKSIFDFVFSFFALLVLIPIFIVIGLLIKLDSPGPVFYCPKRIGKGGKPIQIFKFRTMVHNDDPINSNLSTQKNDPRITRLGKYLRKFSIDELPQFINVFLGDMSVVGPRPHRLKLNRQLQESERNYMIRHYFKPGITGWAQVNGWRGPTETKEQREKRTIYDLWYLENWSFWLDLKIIWRTLTSSKTHKNVF